MAVGNVSDSHYKLYPPMNDKLNFKKFIGLLFLYVPIPIKLFFLELLPVCIEMFMGFE